MPTYEYRCPDGHDFERFYRKISDAPHDVACPDCGKIAERKMSAGAGLLFKGSGFYLTDYGKNAHRGEAPPSGEGKGGKSGGDSKSGESGSASASESKGGGESKSESKSESKGDSKGGESKGGDAKPASAPAPAAPKPGKSDS